MSFRRFRFTLLLLLISILLMTGCIPVSPDTSAVPPRPDIDSPSSSVHRPASQSDPDVTIDRGTLIDDASPRLAGENLTEDHLGESFVVSGEILSISRAKSGNLLIEVQTDDSVFPVYIKKSTGVNDLQFTPGVTFEFRGTLALYDGTFEILPASEEDILRQVEYSFEKIYITNVIDGDTVWAQMSDGSEEKIRLIGVDAPETEKPDKAAEPLAEEAADYTREMILDQYVYLEMDNDDRDKYGRLLAYIWLEIPEEITPENVRSGNISALLLAQGLAEPIAVGDNDKYYDLFLDIASDAAA